MADSDLEEIRARRLAELQQQYGEQDPNARKEQEAAQKRKEDMINSILTQVLDQNARARLNSIALVKPEKAKMVEMMLIQMAQTGQLPGRIGEDQLKGLLEKVSMQTQRKTKINFDRRRVMDSDDDDY
ncbi:programmed cell death protein 5-like [Acanthaster planci]|uniref:Programmed cell death protein 5 n=1 Tax=Acanthaster planci TaxID=133434 RepID=A0A8B7YFE1_ACAPL|nr:programmed cell death protein 5-like [Acanthaster planci]